MLDGPWAAVVFELCDAVFRNAGVGFVGRQVAGKSPVTAFLWEADPRQFIEKYPDSDLIESYGEENWPGVPCIDYWVYVEPEHQRLRVSVEGWSLDEFFVEATGHAARDGHALASVLARILQVPWPLATTDDI